MTMILDIFNWKQLNSIRTNRVVKTSYLWLVIVPLFIKLNTALKVGTEKVITLFNLSISWPIELPFNYYIFYASAVLFSAGGILNFWWYPKIIQENDDFNEFKDNARNSSHLQSYFDEINSDTVTQALITNYRSEKPIESYEERIPITADQYETIYRNKFNPSYSIAEETAYSGVYTEALQAKIIKRRGINFLYIAGFICIGIVTIQNIIVVIKNLVASL